MTSLKVFKRSYMKRLNWLEFSWISQKPYEVLNHKIQLSKLDAYGIRGVENLWFKSQPFNLKQCTEANYVESTKEVSESYTSDFKEIKHSVHQGSVLCPILFLLYVKDLPFNPLNRKRRLLYLKTQFIPRSKHFSSRL